MVQIARGLPCRNLFRHRREYPDPQQFPVVYGGFAGGLAATSGETQSLGFGPYPGMLGADPAATAQDDDYELRRARTPVPEFVAEAVEIHLSKVYDQEVTRDGPTDLTEWWKDVDGRGTPIDDWMRETVAPLLLVLGCLDICLDHPNAPPGESIKTRADELRLGLDKCVASYILPENMVWWRCDDAGRYVECLVREYQDPAVRIDVDKNGVSGRRGGRRRNRLKLGGRITSGTGSGNPTKSILYSYDGDQILERMPHSFGRVPIVRLIDLKKHRTPTIGKSRYEAIAELQREYYNRDSELILSDTLQAHPLLSGPEDYCKADNTLSIGPGYVLPKKKNPESGAYEGWEYTSPPKDPAASLRQNKQDLIDMKDRRACLTKPAGAAAGSGGGSRRLDGGSVGHLQAARRRGRAQAARVDREVIGSRGTVHRRIRAAGSSRPRGDHGGAREGQSHLSRAFRALQRFGAHRRPDPDAALIQIGGHGPDRPRASGTSRSFASFSLGCRTRNTPSLDHEIESMLAKKSETKDQPSASYRRPGSPTQADAFAGDGFCRGRRLAKIQPASPASTMIGNMIPSVE